jgi:hypothetical protein
LLIHWNRNTESNISHYNVYRDSTEDFTPGPSNLLASPVDAFFHDAQWSPGLHFYYKVTAVNSYGDESPFALLRYQDVVTGVEGSRTPMASYLSQNHPNPFNPVTEIDFGLRETALASLRIYDVTGRLLRVVAEGRLPAGRYSKIWDSRDGSGRPVASGVYFCRLDAGSFTRTKKMVLLR